MKVKQICPDLWLNGQSSTSASNAQFSSAVMYFIKTCAVAIHVLFSMQRFGCKLEMEQSIVTDVLLSTAVTTKASFSLNTVNITNRGICLLATINYKCFSG